MKTQQIKSLMFVAAVAVLPAACGTSSPTSMDVAAIESGASFSAHRAAPGTGLPPHAEPTSPLPVPMPEATPDPKADVVPVEAAPAVEPPTGRRPGRTVPPPPPTDPQLPPNGDPVPPTGDPMPIPPTDPAPSCAVDSIQIVPMTSSAREPIGQTFVAILFDKSGAAIEDNSCEKLAWEADGGVDETNIVITYGGSDTRTVSITGMQNGTKVGATAPNGVSGSFVIVLPSTSR